MAWLAISKSGQEGIYPKKPTRISDCFWECTSVAYSSLWYHWNQLDLEVKLPKGSIEKLIGKTLTWEDEPVEYV